MPAIPLIPRVALFGNPSRHQARISPDGEWLTWLAPFEGVLNVWLAPAEDVGASGAGDAGDGTPDRLAGLGLRRGTHPLPFG